MLSWGVLIFELSEALHEAMLHAFCREAAWLMQASGYKVGDLGIGADSR